MSLPSAADADHLRQPLPDLRTPLGTLISAAHRNEAALRKFQAIELDLMAADSLGELLHRLLREAPQRLKWDVVSLQLYDPRHEIRHALSESGWPAQAYPELRWVERKSLLSNQFFGEPPPRLGAYEATHHSALYLHAKAQPRSVALLALRRGQRWLGSYNIGSNDGVRFHPKLATDFLQHLSAIIAVCIETALNREQLKRLGLTDPLTGVGNRRYFDQRLHEEVARAQRVVSPLSCLFVDVDHFKAINDRHGHSAGDEVLRTVAQRIRAELRSADIVARYGGEEFSVLLPQADAARAADVAERIRRCIASTPFNSEEAHIALCVSVSVGAATRNGTDGALEDVGGQLLERADTALYRAKRNGRNRVVIDS